jgi:hypothetical protein
MLQWQQAVTSSGAFLKFIRIQMEVGTGYGLVADFYKYGDEPWGVS